MEQRDQENQTLQPKIEQQHEDINYQPLVDPSLVSRLGFVRKVYSILSIQLLFTVLFSCISINCQRIIEFELRETWMFSLAVIFFIVTMCMLFCCVSNARKAPRNYILLSIFTISLAYIISVICCSILAMYENGIQIITMALITTLLMVIGLTFYSYTTSEDFSICRGLLWSFQVCVFSALLFSFIFINNMLEILVAACIIFFYSLYLLCDTQLIVGGKRYQLKQDDYIIGVMILYIDIIYLFLETLKILAILFGKK